MYRHKPRLTVLEPKIEALPDVRPSGRQCLHRLSVLFKSVGNRVEYNRVLTYALKLHREGGDDCQAALALRSLSDVCRGTCLCKEGIQLVKEALEIYKKLGDTVGQAECSNDLAWLLCDDGQLDAAEEAASHAIDLLPEKHEQILGCLSHRVLGRIYRSKGKIEKAIHHFETALRIATSLNAHHEVFWIHFSLAQLLRGQGRFDDAHAHIEQGKSFAIDHTYYLARAMQLQAKFRHEEGRLKEAKSGALHVVDVFEKLGATKYVEDTRDLLQQIEKAKKKGEPPEIALLSTHIDFPFSSRE